MPSSTTWSPNDLRNPRVSIIIVMTHDTFLWYTQITRLLSEVPIKIYMLLSKNEIFSLATKLNIHGGKRNCQVVLRKNARRSLGSLRGSYGSSLDSEHPSSEQRRPGSG